MCEWFTNRLTWREIVELYGLTLPATPQRNLPARYNICPTNMVDAVIERNVVGIGDYHRARFKAAAARR
jgi:putative SOS response-associated peptidase YedK